MIEIMYCEGCGYNICKKMKVQHTHRVRTLFGRSEVLYKVILFGFRCRQQNVYQKSGISRSPKTSR